LWSSALDLLAEQGSNGGPFADVDVVGKAASIIVDLC